ncbi:ThuA domain-containing protein [Planctomycetaceae bacterium SH139]
MQCIRAENNGSTRSPRGIKLRFTRRLTLVLMCLLGWMQPQPLPAADAQWLDFPGGDGPGKGKHVVLISGDEEYRSEEALPQLAKILSARHGFRCTTLFAIDPKTGEISPDTSDNIPGLEALKTADLMVIATRFRNLPDDQMQHIADYLAAGKPVIGLRTATHAFNIPGDRKFAKFSFNSRDEDFRQGFGRQVLGETWINHHGHHKVESTRGIIPAEAGSHPLLSGIESGDIWGPTDVYGVRLPLPGDSQPLVLGQVLQGMSPQDQPVDGKKNDPMMPIAWVKTYNGARVFCTTMGAATDLPNAGVRRLLVNATFWAVGLEEKITPDLSIEVVGTFNPTEYGFGGYQKGRKPSDYAISSD